MPPSVQEFGVPSSCGADVARTGAAPLAIVRTLEGIRFLAFSKSIHSPGKVEDFSCLSATRSQGSPVRLKNSIQPS